MATVSKNFTPADIGQGPMDVFLNIKAPPSAVPPVQYTNTLQLDASGQPPDSSTAGQILTIALGSAPGSGYAVGDVVLITGGGGSNGLAVVLTVSGSAVATLAVLRPGTGYSTGANLATVHQTGGGNDALTITISTIQAGIHLGLSDGPCMMSTHPKFNPIHADQFGAPVDVAFVSLATEVDIILKELTLRNLQQYFVSPLTGTYFNLPGSPVSSTNPAADFLQIGSPRSSQSVTATLTLVTPRRDVSGKWIYAQFYRSYVKSPFSLTLDRKKETTLKLKWGCLADTARVAKDQVGIIVRST